MYIQMTPNELFDAASKIRAAATDYQADYTKLIATVDDLCTTAYIGEDSTLFKGKIDNFKTNFEAMHIIMENYAEYLSNTAQTMLDMIEENNNKINSISEE